MEEEITNFELILEHYFDAIQSFSVKIVSALVILLVGILLIRFLRGFVRKIIEKREVDPTVSSFLTSMISWLLKLLLFIAVISKLGIETTSFVAVLGAIGLGISLSLQGSLANFTGGLLIIMFKPFKLGDYIEAQGVSGTVKNIQIFNTQINNDNNQVVFIPNGILSNGTIINYSRENIRRANLKITVSAYNDLSKIHQMFMDILLKNDKVLDTPAPVVFLAEVSGDVATFYVRPWSERTNFFAMSSEVLLEIRDTLDKENIKLPHQRMEVVNQS